MWKEKKQPGCKSYKEKGCDGIKLSNYSGWHFLFIIIDCFQKSFKFFSCKIQYFGTLVTHTQQYPDFLILLVNLPTKPVCSPW